MKSFVSFVAGILSVDISKPELRRKLTNGIWISLVIVIGLLVLSIFLWQDEEYGNFGQVGDFFNGILGPILSLITITLVYATYRVQKEELKATLDELRKTAESMQDQKKIMEMQEETQKQIRCDSIMLKMVEEYFAHASKRIPGFKKCLIDAAKDYLKKTSSDPSKFKKNPEHCITGITKYFLGELQKDDEYNNYKRVVYILVSAFAAPYYTRIKDEEYLNHIRIYVNNQLFLLDEILLESIFILNRADLTKAFMDIKPVRHLPTDFSLEALIKEYLLKILR